jgi:hypothetical protein
VVDHQALEVAAASGETLELIPLFGMPWVPEVGPLYFYAAMFQRGTLSLDTLVSNGAFWEFELR